MPAGYSTFNTKGLSLIECSIAMLILIVMIGGGLSIHMHATTLMTLAMHKKIALEIAVQEMEKIKKAGYSVPLTDKEDWEDFPDQTFGLFTAQIRKKVSEIGPAPKMKKVELEVSWREAKGNDDKKITLETYLSPP